MTLEFISQGRNSSVRQLIRTSNVETAVANTWTVSSLLPGLNRRVFSVFSTLNFKGQSPGSAGGGGGRSGDAGGGNFRRGGNGGIGIAGAFINTNITKASSIGSYTITLGSTGNSAMNNSNNIQAGGKGGTVTGQVAANGGTISSNLVFAGANTFIVPFGGAGGGGGSIGPGTSVFTCYGGQSFGPGGDGNPGIAGKSANAAFFGLSGNGGTTGSAGCYSGRTIAIGRAQTAIAFTQLSGATYIYPTNTAPPAHGISTWTSNNYGAGAAGQISIPLSGTGSNSTPAANGSAGVFRLTVSGIRI